MKICLATLHRNKRFIPLALLYLKAYLVERRGHDTRDITILEYDQDSTPEAIVNGLLASEPDVLGLSIYVWNVKTLMAVARRVKEGDQVPPFVTAFCDQHGIPAAFYNAFTSREFSPRTPAGPAEAGHYREAAP